jgi:hypothetical protein
LKGICSGGDIPARGDVIRVSVLLSDPKSRSTRWAQRYDLRANDMLKFQDEVAQKVVEGLSVSVTEDEEACMTAPMTHSPEAYNLYIQARFYWNEYSMRSRLESLQRGRALLKEAIKLDSTFAQAYTLLADLCLMEGPTLSTTLVKIWRTRNRWLKSHGIKSASGGRIYFLAGSTLNSDAMPRPLRNLRRVLVWLQTQTGHRTCWLMPITIPV